MKGYQPPFTMTEEVANLLAEVAELCGRISALDTLSTNPILRRENRIRSIHSSLAIEQNSLTLDQVTDVIEGKRVLGPAQDIREVQNAYQVYEMLLDFNPFQVEDLLKAHQILMLDLIKEAGMFRSKGVGVYSSKGLIHAGTLPQYVPELVRDLFAWLGSTGLHPLIASSIFHYEFEFIHPFADGNGRIGRFWHTLILSNWKEFFRWLPIETVIKDRQEEYYLALNTSNRQGESTQFVCFMLEVIKETIKELSYITNNRGDLSEELLLLLSENPSHTAKTMAEKLKVSDRQIQRILKDLKEKEKIERVGNNRKGFWIVK